MAVMTCLIAWLFYDSVFGLISAVIVVPCLAADFRREQKRRAQYQLEQQFQTGLLFAAGALEAGYSMENAWREMEREVIRLYGKQAVFSKMLHQVNQSVGMNEPLEGLVWNMAKQNESENMKNFAEVFYFARRSGGNMTQIMRRTAGRISQSFAVLEEIQLALASRQLELVILHVMPLAILGYLRFGSAEFLTPLYHNVSGVFIMSSCLGLYGFAWWLSKKLIRIGE